MNPIQALEDAGIEVTEVVGNKTSKGYIYFEVFFNWHVGDNQKIEAALKPTEWRRMNSFFIGGLSWITIFEVKDLDALGASGLK